MSYTLSAVLIVLVLLLAVVVSDFLSRMLPVLVPPPLVQVGVGALIGLSPALSVRLDPELFFLLFVPPLLFRDGWRIPNEDLISDRKAILQLSLGLVALTVIGMGWFIHWMIPAIPLAVSLALAAVVSPTDPISIATIGSRIAMPPRVMRLLSGEALLNDASGLVCFRFAVAAALSGAFSVYDAAFNLVWTALGGVALGVGIAMGLALGSNWLAKRVGEESGAQIIVSILIPFIAYLGAEHVGCSGILAAVAAGVTMSHIETSGEALASTRMQRGVVWDTLHFAVNGMVFVLLGQQLPAIVAGATQAMYAAGQWQAGWLLVYILAISMGLIVLRFAWIGLSLKVIILRARLSGEGMREPNWRLVTALSLGGVRGAITLAGAMTLPFTLQDGSPFPARELVILLAMGVIVMSMLGASVGLPLLFKHGEGETTTHADAEAVEQAQENQARIIAAQAAMAEIHRWQDPAHQERPTTRELQRKQARAADALMEYYRQRIQSHSRPGHPDTQRDHQVITRALRIAAIKAEREAIFTLLRNHQIGSETATRLVKELDLLETRHDV